MTPIEPPIAGEPAGEPVAGSEIRRALVALSLRTQAVGALMVELGVSAEAARDRLAARARDAGRPVDDVAREVLAAYAGSADDDRGSTSDVG